MDSCMGTAISSNIIRYMEDNEDEIKDKQNKVLLKNQNYLKENKIFKGIRSLLKFSDNLQHYFSYFLNSVKIYVYNLLPGPKCQVFFNKRDCKARADE